MVAAPDPDRDPETVGSEAPELEQPDDDVAADEPNGQPPTVDTSRRGRIGRIVAVALVLGALGAAWTLASPIGAAPDDGFHLASIWCSPTARDGACTNLGDAFAAGKDFVEVPAEIGPGAHCYAFDATRSAACQEAIEPGSTVRTLADDGVYPGLYYSLMGFTVTGEPVYSALLARVVSWTLSIGFLAAGWYVLPRRHRDSYLMVLLVTAVPMALWLWASTNPSGLVVASIAASWCAVVALAHAGGRRELAIAGALLAACVIAAAGSRADGGVYAFVAIVSAGVLVCRQDRSMGRRVLAGLAIAGLGLVVSVIVLTMRVESIEALVSPGDPSGAAQTGGLFWNNLREIPFFIVLNLGQAPLGWLDTPMPHLVWLPTVAAFFGLFFWGIGRIDRMKALSLACVLGGLLAIPYFLLWRSGLAVGAEIQPRYVLPLVPVLGFTALYWRHSTSVAALTTVQLSTVLGLVTVAHSVALHSNIRRYVTGVGNLSVDLDAGREWWWDIPITPNLVWVLGSVAFGVLAVMVGWTIGRAADRSHEERPSDEPIYA